MVYSVCTRLSSNQLLDQRRRWIEGRMDIFLEYSKQGVYMYGDLSPQIHTLYRELIFPGDAAAAYQFVSELSAML